MEFKAVAFEQLADIMAFRVIVDNVDQCLPTQKAFTAFLSSLRPTKNITAALKIGSSGMTHM